MKSIQPKIKTNDPTAEFCMNFFEMSVPSFPMLGGKTRQVD
jgi:hypothetical protein